jgi:hypothetical protein
VETLRALEIGILKITRKYARDLLQKIISAISPYKTIYIYISYTSYVFYNNIVRVGQVIQSFSILLVKL